MLGSFEGEKCKSAGVFGRTALVFAWSRFKALEHSALAKQGVNFILLQIIGLHLIIKLHGLDEDALAQTLQGIVSA